MQIDKEACGRRIAELRKKRNYTQEKFAAIIGVGTEHLNRIENGKAGFSKELMLDIGFALRCSADYILTGVDSVATLKDPDEQIIEIGRGNTANMLYEIAEIVKKYESKSENSK